jgi:hypothetical protein
MFLFFAQKRSVKANSYNQAGWQARRNQIEPPLWLLVSYESKPNIRQAGRRYETTSENDNNLNYDKPFMPAYSVFSSIRAQILGANLPSIQKV